MKTIISKVSESGDEVISIGYSPYKKPCFRIVQNREIGKGEKEVPDLSSIIELHFNPSFIFYPERFSSMDEIKKFIFNCPIGKKRERLTDDNLPEILDFLQKSESLEIFSLTGKLTLSSIPRIISVLDQSRNLKILNLKYIKLDVPSLGALVDCLIKSSPNLLLLNLSYLNSATLEKGNILVDPSSQERGSSHFSRLIENHKELKILDIRNNNFREKDASILANALKTPHGLEQLHMSFGAVKTGAFSFCEEGVELDLLNLECNGLCLYEKKLNFQLFGNIFSNIKILNLRSNGLRDRNMEEMLDNLEVVTSLMALDLSFNKLTDKFAEKIKNSIGKLPNLEELSISGNSFFLMGTNNLIHACFNTLLSVLNLGYSCNVDICIKKDLFSQHGVSDNVKCLDVGYYPDGFYGQNIINGVNAKYVAGAYQLPSTLTSDQVASLGLSMSVDGSF